MPNRRWPIWSCRHLSRAKKVADLFAGCGSFALRLAKNSEVHAVESDAAALAALDRGFRFTPGLKRVTTERRDLFRRPLTFKELNAFDGLVFDPPRAGAEDQSKQIARSDVPYVAAVSCNPATLARDLSILIAGGYRLKSVTPIDQFLWSPHVEAVALLEKPRKTALVADQRCDKFRYDNGCGPMTGFVEMCSPCRRLEIELYGSGASRSGVAHKTGCRIDIAARADGDEQIASGRSHPGSCPSDRASRRTRRRRAASGPPVRKPGSANRSDISPCHTLPPAAGTAQCPVMLAVHMDQPLCVPAASCSPSTFCVTSRKSPPNSRSSRASAKCAALGLTASTFCLRQL